MAINWTGGPTPPSDPSTFDYDTATQKLQRQRAAAQALQAISMQSNQGQFIKSGDFMGYAGGNTLGSTAARIAAAFLGANANDSADTAQKQLGQDSQSALTWALDPRNSPAGQRGAAEQTQHEADLELRRETARANSTVQGGDHIDPQAGQDAQVQTFRVEPQQTTSAPLTRAATQLAAKALTAPAVAPVSPSVTARPSGQSVTGGPQSLGTGADFSRRLAPQTKLPVGTSGALSADDIAFASKMLGSAPTTSTSGTHQNPPQSSAVPTSTSALPPMPPQAPAAPTLEDKARSLGIDPTAQRGPGDPTLAQQVQVVARTQAQMANGIQTQGDPRSMVDQSAARANGNASYGEQMANLQQLSRTGPMGQQLATAMMQSQYSKDWGDIKNADGATVGVYNKRNPNETVGFQGVRPGTKETDTMINLVKSTDPSNPEAVARLNQTLGTMGFPAMTSEVVRGMGMTNEQRTTASHGSAVAISSISKARGEAAAQVADLGKINNDLQYAMSIANDAAGRYSGIQGSFTQWFGGGADTQKLNRILNDSMLMSIMQDKGGSGTAGVGLMTAYQKHGLKATMNPEALQQGLQQIQAAVEQRVSGKQAEVSAHDYSLNALGYQPQAQTQGPAQQTNSGAPVNGRAPGNYRF
jgi:hypothetical protein